MVILVNGFESLNWLVKKALRRLNEECSRLQVDMNEDKTKIVDLEQGETFSFLGFEYRLVENKGKKMVLIRPTKKKVNEIIDKVRTHIKTNRHLSVWEMVRGLNPIIRGWINYFRIGHCSRLFSFIRNWVEKKVRRFARKAQGRKGFGWKEWDSKVVYEGWQLFNDYQIRYYQA